MKHLRCSTQSPIILLLSFTFFSLFPFFVIADNECPPATWHKGPVRSAATTRTPAVIFKASASVANMGNAQPGQVNCRYSANTYSDVNCCTCAKLAKRYGITLEVFFMLNPDVNPDCGNIEQNTKYCVAGFIEPVRAFDGLCGPKHNNATCLGTPFQCCNAETWTCGNSTSDCAPGTCYEGACVGDKVYSTDGTCGHNHGNRQCIGKWGDCCSMEGKCGTGPDFCGIDVCQWGNCTRPSRPPPTPPPWLSGNTTDGTCGGVNRYSCDVVYGNCCNKDGICGSLPEDCGEGW